MSNNIYEIILVDDKEDDGYIFIKALTELAIEFHLKIISNGVELYNHLTDKNNFKPDIIFLAINMPLVNGFDCLSEIKADEDLKHIPVIIISTFVDDLAENTLHNNEVAQTIKKPNNLNVLKRLIARALFVVENKKVTKLTLENFIIHK